MGNNVECPVCGSYYSKFIPSGYVESRDNALCPRCLSLERHRLLWMYLQNETSFFEAQARVLHVAPEYIYLVRKPQYELILLPIQSAM